MSDQKLKSLMAELKVQDKEEITLKKLKHEGGDKEGLKEAELRKRLRGNIYSIYVYLLCVTCFTFWKFALKYEIRLNPFSARQKQTLLTC